MKIILFSRPLLSHTAEALRRLVDAIRRAGCDFAVNEEFAPLVRESIGGELEAGQIYGATVGPQPEGTVMLCYGGDGTLLEGVQRLGGESVAVMGVNAGHLGFLTTADHADVDILLEKLAKGELATEPRAMLRVDGDLPPQVATRLALNEFTIQRSGAGLISVETYVDSQMVATYHGDGVIVSTPTGSTAYSLSAGGPVVSPTCACMVLSPLAPHNLTMRPVVIPDTAQVRLKVHVRHAEAFVTLDNLSYPISGEASFTIGRAAQPVFLVVPHNISFYDTLRDKMMWGIDIRS